MTGSEWLVELAIEAAPFAWDKVLGALDSVGRQLGLRLRFDALSRQIVLGAQSEQHLRCALLCLKAAIPDGYRAGAVQVAYGARPDGPSEADYAHMKQSGSSGEFAAVILRLVPGGRGSGFQLFNEVACGNVPAKWVPSIEKGAREAAEAGGSFGLPLIDVEVHLIDGKYHDLDSSPAAFEQAGAGAMRKAIEGAGIVVLEPIVKVAVVAPERLLATTVAELERRNAAIDEIRSGETCFILGAARMVDLLGFEEALSLATGGCARSAIALHEYVEAPRDDGPDDSYPLAAALRA